MAIPANICVAWPSTVASIPAGWSRETALDSRYILGASPGADTDLTTDRGSTTHTHTSPSHTPTQNSHTHTFNAAGGDATPIVTGTAAASAADVLHGHNDATSLAGTGTNQGVAITVNATSNDLAFATVIWIKSDGSPTTLPSGCIALYASDTFPSGWSRVNGSQYLKGAAAAADGGATGGALTHTHTSPAHTHTQNGHTHGATASAGPNVTTVGKGTGSDTVATSGHTHSISLVSALPTNQSVTTTITATNHEPPYTQINLIQSSSTSLPTGIIALWLGTNATVPSGWTRYTTLDGQWIKGSSADGQVGTTGGSSQHSHTASSCQPTQDAHTHTASDPGSTGTISAAPGGSSNYTVPGHTHAWTVVSTVATNIAAAVTVDLCSANAALPQHRTVILVQLAAVVARTGVYTSYDFGLFDIGDPRTELLPEQGKKIAQGDLRFVPRS